MQFNRCLGCMEEIQSYPCPHCGFDPRTAPASNYVLPYGTVLNGHYMVGKVLGQGGFGITYMGYDLSLERKVAIKEFYPRGQAMRMSAMSSQLHWGDDAASQDFRTTGMDSFLREARKMAKVEDIPEVVGVRESFQENGTAYIIMDYIEGRTLLSVLKEKGPMPWEQARDIFLPAISAMEQVHQAGLVHRDLSPDNLMLTSKGVRILDLGAAKDISSGNGASSAQVAKGGFSPLEQYTQRGSSGPWSDVYAMAATIYYTLTGILPPSSTDRVEEDTINWAVLSEHEVPENVIVALQNAMHITAQGRTQSMAELLRQLQGGKPRPGKKTLLCAAAVIAVLGIALGLAFGLRSNLPSPSTEAAALGAHIAAETTQPSRAHIMAAAEDLSQIDTDLRMNQPFWGQTDYLRRDVESITFRSTLSGVPDNAWDVSDAGDRSVLAWMEEGDLFVASDGIIYPNENASWMFAYFVNAEFIDFGGCFDTTYVTNMLAMFSRCQNLTQLDVSGFRTSNAVSMNSMFYGCSNLMSLDVSGFDTANVTSMRSMFYECSSLECLDLSGFDTSNVKNLAWMLAKCRGLAQVDLSGFDTANVTDMSRMFYECGSLAQLDVSCFDTANVTTMSGMFYECGGLTQLDVSGFDTANVADMSYLFSCCDGLTQLDVSGFDTANVTDMTHMFSSCHGLTQLDVSGFDTANVTDMTRMFSSCDGLTQLDISGFDTANVTDMNGMFSGCESLTKLDLSTFDTANVTNMCAMFESCKSLIQLDVSGFDTAMVTDMSFMFSCCENLTQLDVSGFDTARVTDMTYIFQLCTRLNNFQCTDQQLRAQYNQRRRH